MIAGETEGSSVHDGRDYQIEPELRGPRPRQVRQKQGFGGIVPKLTKALIGLAIAFIVCLCLHALTADPTQGFAVIGASICAFVFVFLLVFKLVAAQQLGREMRFLRDGIAAVATVTDRRSGSDSDSGTTYVLACRWCSEDGSEWRRDVYVAGEKYEAHPVGAQFTLLYDPGKPSTCMPYFNISMFELIDGGLTPAVSGPQRPDER